MLPVHRLSLGAAAPVPGRPNAGEREQRTIAAPGEPNRRFARLRVLPFAKRCRRYETSTFRPKPSAPMRAGGMADPLEVLLARSGVVMFHFAWIGHPGQGNDNLGPPASETRQVERHRLIRNQ
jgi:hypothetical protein